MRAIAELEMLREEARYRLGYDPVDYLTQPALEVRVVCADETTRGVRQACEHIRQLLRAHEGTRGGAE